MFATYAQLRSELNALAEDFDSSVYTQWQLTHDLFWPPVDGGWTESAVENLKSIASRNERELWQFADDGFCHRFLWATSDDCLATFGRMASRAKSLLHGIQHLVEKRSDEIPDSLVLDDGDWLELIHDVAEKQPTARLSAEVQYVNEIDTIGSRLSLDLFAASAEFLRVCLCDSAIVCGDYWGGDQPVALPSIDTHEVVQDSADLDSSLKTAKEMPARPPEALNADDAADFIGVNTSTIDYLVRRRKIRYVQVGDQRGRVFRIDDLKQFLEERTKSTALEELASRSKR